MQSASKGVPTKKIGPWQNTKLVPDNKVDPAKSRVVPDNKVDSSLTKVHWSLTNYIRPWQQHKLVPDIHQYLPMDLHDPILLMYSTFSSAAMDRHTRTNS